MHLICFYFIHWVIRPSRTPLSSSHQCAFTRKIIKISPQSRASPAKIGIAERKYGGPTLVLLVFPVFRPGKQVVTRIFAISLTSYSELVHVPSSSISSIGLVIRECLTIFSVVFVHSEMRNAILSLIVFQFSFGLSQKQCHVSVLSFWISALSNFVRGESFSLLFSMLCVLSA